MAARPPARHAMRSRAALAGVSSVLFVGGVAALARHDATASWSGGSAPATDTTESPATTVLVQHVPRTIYLDRYGNVLAGPPDPASGTAAATPSGPVATTPGAATQAPRPAGASPAPGAPKATPGPVGSPTAPAPTAPHATTPTPTSPPATTPPPPPPTTVPKCTGSKCPP